MKRKKCLVLFVVFCLCAFFIVLGSSLVHAQTEGTVSDQSSQSTVTSTGGTAPRNLTAEDEAQARGQQTGTTPQNKVRKEAKVEETSSPVRALTWFLFGAGLFFMLIFVISSTKIVPQGYAGVVERFGRYIRTEGPGLLIVMPLVSRVRLISLKEQVDEYKPQTVITSDNVTVNIDAVLFFQIIDAAKPFTKFTIILWRLRG